MKMQVLPGTLAPKTHELQVHTGEIGNLIDDFDLSARRVACSSIRAYPRVAPVRATAGEPLDMLLYRFQNASVQHSPRPASE
jgi:hypothetical protein